MSIKLFLKCVKQNAENDIFFIQNNSLNKKQFTLH